MTITDRVLSTLPELEAAPVRTVGGNPNLAAVLTDVAGFVRRFVVVEAAQAATVALFVVHTYTCEAAEATPYLHVKSPTKRAGKTRLIEVLNLLVRAPLATLNTSDAALFRSIEELHPTLLMDEIDALYGAKARDREDLRALLNAGHRRGAFVLRMGGPKMTTLERFEVFCPKVLAGIGDLPDTIADRCIPIRLKRKTRTEKVERFRVRDATEKAGPLQQQLAGLDVHVPELEHARPDLPEQLGDRAQDAWEPLLAIAELAGGDWPARARESALLFSAEADAADDVLGVRLLHDVQTTFARNGNRLSTAALIEMLKEDEEAPWLDWQGSGLTAKRLADLLRPFGIKSRSIRFEDGKTPKGYLLEQFEDAFARYLTPSNPISKRHNATARADTGVAADFKTPHDAFVADGKQAANPHGKTDVALWREKRALGGAGEKTEGVT